VRRCDELARVLRTIGEEYEESDIVLGEKDEHLSMSMSIDEVEVKIREVEDELSGLKGTQDLLSKNHNALKEQKIVLELGTKIYKKKEMAGASTLSVERSSTSELMALSEFATTGSSLLGQVSGVIKKEQAHALERVLFRATRGNAVFETEPVQEELLDVDSKGGNESVEKVFFMALFAGEVMRDKISKICSYFGASLYKFPESADDLAAMSLEVESRLVESAEILSKGAQVINELLLAFASTYRTWDFVVQKEKMVFDALNMCEFDIKRHVFIAEGWVPSAQYEVVVQALQDATTECGLDTRPIINKLDSRLTPPTYIPVTNFTSGFQALVNTYGTPRYREANPGAFCCIFFPFLFGIMFGDFGHGLMLAMFGYFLIQKEKDWGDGAGLNDMVQMCYGGRYIIFLNGLFGAYVGFMYNEAFAFPMNWFSGTRWAVVGEPGEPCEVFEDGTVPTCELPASGPYPVGIDPIWHYTANKITFFNSFKMKISIIVGVIQMTVGICLSLLNHIEYKDYKRIAFEYIPEMVFFEGIFGYLVFCIFYKWSVDWNGDVGVPGNPGPQPAPSLLTLLINMFMSPTTDIAVPLYGQNCYTDCGAALSDGKCGVALVATNCPLTCSTGVEGTDKLFAGGASAPETKICFSELQSSVQFQLLIAAFAAVPFLLIPIPFIELWEHNKEMAAKKQYENLVDEKDKDAPAAGDDDDDEHGFSFGDAFIHQAIHTIEFVLGSISNTASYLRLWALSLAHSQLAELFKDMILTDIGFKSGLPSPFDGLVCWFAFAAWGVISLIVLMVMENLSSFLHALRLQWVEFQNKFFYGDGNKYSPFTYKTIAAPDSEE
jgi:V-type H+-transporting ATPase subunit a